MSAIVIMELQVRPMDGCTLWHADDDSTWTVARNDDPDEFVVLTREMVAEALDNSRYFGSLKHGLGHLWVFSGNSHALAFRAAMTEGESAS